MTKPTSNQILNKSQVTGTTVTEAMNNLIAGGVPVFTPTTSGTVPASGGGSNFLRADGVWSPLPGVRPPDDDYGDVVVTGTGTVMDVKTSVINDATKNFVVGGTNINVVYDNINDELVINATGSAAGEANTASNVGTGSGVFKQKTGVDLEFKTLTAGSNITITPGANDLVISSTASGSGDVAGPASAVNNNIAVFDGTTGKLIKDGGATIASKQDTLVSGTSIKTVNSTSLLGSGDVAVQPTLVSGTNIKTVNGNTLLGSGDLVISASGGIAYTRKTAAYTMVANEGIIADTTGGPFTVNLPLTPTTGTQVWVADGGNWASNNLTVDPNGATIEGFGVDENLVADIGGCELHFLYDGTKWQVYVQAASVDGNVVTTTAVQTLSNKSINLANNTLTTTVAQFNTAVTDGDFADLTKIRERLTAARTYYVRTDGNDSNTGLVNNSGGAFLTIQKAIDTVTGTLDLGIYNVTIQVADGTYTNTVALKSYLTGGGQVSLVGNTTTPANVVVSTTSANAFSGNNCGLWRISGIKVQTTTSGRGFLVIGKGTQIEFNGLMDFGTCVNEHMLISTGAVVRMLTNWNITGGSSAHVNASSQGQFAAAALTCTLTGTPAFTYFAECDMVSLEVFQSITFTGSATGGRYRVQTNGVINTYGGGATYLPGNTAGTALTGGQYV